MDTSSSTASVSMTPASPSLPGPLCTHRRSASLTPLSPSSPSQTPLYNTQAQDACIIRVSLEHGNGNLYKSILVNKHVCLCSCVKLHGYILTKYVLKPVWVIINFFLSLKQLTNQDKTPAVISRAMAKHNLEVEPEEGYELVQVIAEDRGKKKKQDYFWNCSWFRWGPLQKL